MTIYQEKEVQMGKYYYSFSSQNLGKKYPQWMVACRILEKSPAEFAKFVKEEYNAIISWHNETNFLSKKWENGKDATRWRAYINKVAKQKKFHI